MAPTGRGQDEMRNYTILSLTGAAAILALTGCDVEKTADGEMPDVDVAYEEGKLPDYEVRKTEEGRMPDVDVDVKGGELPEYDVDTPDVDVGTKQVEVTVPDVDVTMPDEKEAQRDPE